MSVRTDGHFNSCTIYLLTITLLVFGSSSALAKPTSLPEKIIFQNIFEKQDVVIGSTETMIQDHTGFIWIGGENGLLRYDGYELRPMGTRDNTGAKVKNIFSLFVDSRGTLWISTSTGLVRYEAENETFFRYDNRDTTNIRLPNVHTKRMAELPNGELVLATVGGLAIINTETQSSRILLHDPNDKNSLSSNQLWGITVDRQGNAWIGGDNAVDKISWATGQITRYPALPKSDKGITPGQVLCITEDRRGDIWIGTQEGLNRLNPNTETITQFVHDPNNSFSLGANAVRTIIEDSRGILWIATDQGGLNYYDFSRNQFHQFKNKSGDPESLSSDVVRTILEDRSGDLWVGTYNVGINYYDRSTAAITHYKASGVDNSSLSYNSVMSFSADGTGNYWIGTFAGGLNYFNRTTDQFTHFKHDPQNPHSISTNTGIRTLVDTQGTLWAGTWGGGLNRLDNADGHFTRYTTIEPARPGITQSQYLNSPNVRALKEDRLGNLWLGTQGGALNKFDRKTGLFTHYMPDPNDEDAILYDIIYTMFEDSRGRFWVGTQNSLELMDRESGKFKHFKKIHNDPNGLSNSTIFSIFEDSKNRVWFGTSDGLNQLQEDTFSFRHYGVREGLNDTVIRSIIEGPDGQLWLGTSNGIASLNPETGEIKNYYKSSGWQTGNFNPGAVARTENGELLFGGDYGFSIINVSELETNTAVPPVTLTDFKLFTDSVKIGANDGILANAINHTRDLTLRHEQAMFSFTFSALNFRDSEKNEYAYRLRGFDEDWRYVGTQRYATYTSIEPGDYVLQVIGANNDGVWNTRGHSINIRILPPWWQTWWAYVLYLLAFLGIMAWILLNQKYKRALLEEQNRKLIELDKLKDDFIANTSHELRTPLNGIIGLTDSLLEGAAGNVSELMSMNLKMISMSGRRLANLVNDILDFSKLKNRDIQINLRPTNVYDVAVSVLGMCTHTLSGNHVQLINNIDPQVKAVLADEERLQQILYNLVGNAIKFTHAGSITLSAEVEANRLWIKVTDTGIGIPAGSLYKIFNSFEQLEDHRERVYSGTGLGLAVSKKLVELHGGTIEVESEEGKGTMFRFSLKTTDLAPQSTIYNHAMMESIVAKVLDFSADGFAPTNHSIGAKKDANSNQENHLLAAHTQPSVVRTSNDANLPATNDNGQFRILIVDDDPINQQVLINQLTLQHYQFAVAENGPTALRMIEHDGPFDLILLDIMMPQMSGYEVCSRLRERYSVEELPIIFLTAKNTISDLVDGFELGANDFLTKPISIGELNSRVKTHLQLLNINRNLEQLVDQRTQELTLAHNELKTLDRMVAMISQEIRLDRLLSVILHQATTLFPNTSYVALWNYNTDAECFDLLYTDNEQNSAQHITRSDINDITAVFLQPANRISDHIYLDTPGNESGAELLLPGLPDTQSRLTMSFQKKTDIIGILVIGAQQSATAFQRMNTHNFERLRIHVDSALSKARLLEQLEHQCIELEQLSLTDQLTGLKNRRFLSRYIDHDISLLQRKHYQQRNRQPEPGDNVESDFIFFLLDIDHFKQTNDSLGHAAGDRILESMNTILEPLFRTSDYRIRWGGEEFLIVARFCDRNNASAKAEQIRAAMESFEFQIEPGRVVHKTCSIGYACYPFCKERPSAYTWTQVVDLADLALYAVKRSQRNGWLGFNSCDDSKEDIQYKNIIDNPAREVQRETVSISTNIAEIRWQ
jgi:two-component system, sensor histidine kinase ChiS